MSMKDLDDLLLHELGDILYAERHIQKALGTMTHEAADPELKGALERHEEETGEQIANIEQAFALLGSKPKAQKCAGIKGIIKEHDDFLKDEEPVGEVLETFLIGAALRTEHYEIAAYTALTDLATGLGHADVAKLLRANLRQEKKMAGEVGKHGRERATATA